MALRRVCRVSEIAPGEAKRIDEAEIAVFNVNGDLFAIKDVCTHDRAFLSEGAVEGDTVICPWHGACFSLRSGEALTPPATEPVETFRVVVQGDEIYVDVDD